MQSLLSVKYDVYFAVQILLQTVFALMCSTSKSEYCLRQKLPQDGRREVLMVDLNLYTTLIKTVDIFYKRC